MFRLLFLLTVIFTISCRTQPAIQTHTKNPEPIRLAYGPDSLQFGELYIPQHCKRPTPVVTLIHGGCWRSRYDYTLMDSMSVDLSRRGYAVWNIEYRRTEDAGGGWPGTFLDVGHAFRHLTTLADPYDLDLNNIVIMGHSAGGHLALWLGTMGQQEGSDFYVNDLPQIKGIISLAGINDLAAYYSPTGCGDNTVKLLDGRPDQQQERYRIASPISFLPLNVPQILVNGASDDIVPMSHIQPYFDRAIDEGDPVELVEIDGAGHFEVITPGSIAWPPIVDALSRLTTK